MIYPRAALIRRVVSPSRALRAAFSSACVFSRGLLLRGVFAAFFLGATGVGTGRACSG